MEPFDFNATTEKKAVETTDRVSQELGNTIPIANKNLQMVVIIPAKNESDNILKTLEALSNQKDFNNLAIDKSKFEILVLCHNCADNTYAKCEEFARAFPETVIHVLSLNCDVANTVGAARRVLMNIACRRLNLPNGLIISTDADTIPQSDWLCYLQSYINRNISLICGFIKVNLYDLKYQALTYLAAKDEYLLLRARLESELFPNINDPWPRHNYHWGPNMAVKKHIYEAIGGIRPLHFLEDVDLYYRIIGAGYSVRHCMNSVVTTSTRTDSRCNEGFGAELRDWTEIEGVSYNVESLNKLSLRYEIFSLIKQLYQSPSTRIFDKIGGFAMINPKDLNEMFLKCERYEAMVVNMENYLNKSQSWNEIHKDICVLKACEELKDHFCNSMTNSG